MSTDDNRNRFNSFGQPPSLEQQRTNEDMQYIAAYGQQAFVERQRNALNSKELMRLRDEFAMAVLPSIIAIAEKSGWHWQQSDGFLETVAKKTYMAADQMLAARELPSDITGE